MVRIEEVTEENVCFGSQIQRPENVEEQLQPKRMKHIDSFGKIQFSLCTNGDGKLIVDFPAPIVQQHRETKCSLTPIVAALKHPTMEERSASFSSSHYPFSISNLFSDMEEKSNHTRTKNKWDAKWEKRFEELKQFKEENGHCNVATQSEESKSLGKWVYSQRHRRKEGLLTEDQIKLLDSLGFNWNLRKRKENGFQDNCLDSPQLEDMKPAVGIPFEARVKELEEFRRIHGHCNVSRYKKPYEKLGRWLYDQKRRKQKGLLAESRLLQLEALGVEW